MEYDSGFMRRLLLGTLVLLTGFDLAFIPAAAQETSVPENEDSIVNATVCQLESSPKDYDRKQVRVDAYLSARFEGLSLGDPSCADEDYSNQPHSDVGPHSIWWEYADGAAHEGVTGYLPLEDNGPLHHLMELLYQRDGQMPRAVLIGTFYEAKPPEPQTPEHPLSFLRGFGHGGCCHLFVISRVESVETLYSPDLDYSQGWDARLPNACYAFQGTGVPTNAELRAWQKAAIGQTNDWRYDPIKVAQQELQELKFGNPADSQGPYYETHPASVYDSNAQREPPAPPDPRPTETLLETESLPYRKTYEYIEKDRKSRWIVMVARPYWLEELAGSAEKVIWAPVTSAEVQCLAPGERQEPEVTPPAEETDAPETITIEAPEEVPPK